MTTKYLILSVALYIASVQCGVVPAALPVPYAVAPYASSYNAHYVNHAIAAPVVAAAHPLAAPLVPAAAPLVAHAAYTAPLPAAYHAPYTVPLYGR